MGRLFHVLSNQEALSPSHEDIVIVSYYSMFLYIHKLNTMHWIGVMFWLGLPVVHSSSKIIWIQIKNFLSDFIDLDHIFTQAEAYILLDPPMLCCYVDLLS